MAGVLKVYNAATSTWEDVVNVATSQFTLVENQVPTGTINGTNKDFSVATGFVGSTLKVYKNGVRMKPGGEDYTVTSTGFTMTTAPATGTILLCDYALGNGTNVVGGNSLVSDEVPTGSVNGTNKVFTTSRGYVGATLQVFINGLKQRRGADFVETTPLSGTFTMDEAPLTGDSIFVNYSFNLNPSSNADTVDGINASTTPTANTLLALDSNARFPTSTLGGAWTSYTPTLTNLSGGTINFAKYTQIGKTVIVKFAYTLTGAGVTGNPTITLPVTAASDQTGDVGMIGLGAYLDAANQVYVGIINISTTIASIRPLNAAGTNAAYGANTSATNPFTFGNGDIVSMSFAYEAA